MKPRKLTFVLLTGIVLPSCNLKMNVSMQQQIQQELRKMDSLLRKESYSFEMAKAVDSAYHAGVGEKPADFLSPGEDTATVKINLKEAGAAINLAGFYATECGVSYLCEQTQKKPTDILAAIVNKTIDPNAVLLLNRFANATWKAGQPFRDMKRITRPAFTVANFLPPDEIKKDYDQVTGAASKLLSSMQDVVNSGTKDQMEKLRSLLQSEQYAYEMSGWLVSHYYASQNQGPPYFMPGEDTATITKSVKEQRIATNLAVFYALECGISYLVTIKEILPSEILKSIINNTISKEDKTLFARFANATWKGGQPFRGLNRITGQTFTPFYFLTEADIEKDWVQIRAAAKKLLESL